MGEVRAVITSRFTRQAYSGVITTDVESFMVDSAMDSDTDSWNISIGDPQLKLRDILRRDNEVRLNIFAQNRGKVENLHTGFADEITLDENNVLALVGRDITAVAVDSQHPPGNFKMTRPQIFVARDARALNIGDRLRLAPAKPFKKFAVDGSESYWETWYRLYRKRRMWVWAEPDAAIIAGTLNYNAKPTYFIGGRPGLQGRLLREGWLPVERVQLRSNKQQRIWEVYVIGNRGDVGFVSHARDRSIREWIKKRQVIVRSSTAHNPAEARVEAWEELFEGKVGALEVTLTIADPGYVMRQNRIARVDITEIGLKGDFFVVGCRTFGTQSEGFYQEVRLRERNYAISRRRPDDPNLEATVSEQTQFKEGGVATNLSTPWKHHFVEAANKHHGPWPYKLFLGVLLAIAEQETGFRNVRAGGNTVWPGTVSGQPPSQVTQSAAFAHFASTFANDPRYKRVNHKYAVGPMQLWSDGYKDYADKLSGSTNDELGGGRWMPRYNIIAGAFALRDKLKASGAEATIGRGGTPEQVIWAGVAGYGHHYAGEPAFDPRNRYAREVRKRYEDTYSKAVDAAVDAARASSIPEGEENDEPITMPTGSRADLIRMTLNHQKISFARSVQKDDLRLGYIDTKIMQFLCAFGDAGFPALVYSLKTGHSKFVARSDRVSKHYTGEAVDIANYTTSNPAESARAMQWMVKHKSKFGIQQVIGPVDSLVYPLGHYDIQTLAGHDNHIHVGV